MHKTVLAALAATMVCEPISAATITFHGMPQASKFTTYADAGYNVTLTYGSALASTGTNQTPPNIFTETAFTISVTGGLFTFNSLNVGIDGLDGSVSFVYTGFLAGQQLYADGGVYNSTFSSVDAMNSSVNSSMTLDDLRISIVLLSGSGAKLNNIVVNAATAPEPATWAMMVAGFGAIGATMRRRKAAVSFA